MANRKYLDGQKTAYFRGRKLHGKTLKLPEGYCGSVVEKGQPKPQERSQDEIAEDLEIQEDNDHQIEVGAMHGKSTFDEVVVWGHESIADSGADPYVRGIDEWISFAEQVCLISVASHPSKTSSNRLPVDTRLSY